MAVSLCLLPVREVTLDRPQPLVIDVQVRSLKYLLEGGVAVAVAVVEVEVEVEEEEEEVVVAVAVAVASRRRSRAPGPSRRGRS